jgi:ABC-type cobalamin/Fe3+-siderophores transport system ATPase subunit
MTQTMGDQQSDVSGGGHTFDVNLVAGNNGELEFRARLGRVNVVLGANGAGKSKLMHRLSRTRPGAPGAGETIFVEGGRALKLPAALDAVSLGQHLSTLAGATQHHRAGRVQSLSSRINPAFLRLAHLSAIADSETADALRAWEIAGRKGEPPASKPSQLDRCATMFHEVFPDLDLCFDRESKALNVRRAGFRNPYPADALSDGEKQVLCLLAEIAVLKEPRAFVVVDEPELNLHASLAIRLWETLESEIPDGYFTYATHSVPFAMRPGVETLIVMSAKGAPMVVDHAYDVPPEQLADFLGAAPAMLKSDTLLAVEGRDSSFDRTFYTWLVDDPGVTVSPVGDCERVRTVAQGAEVWATAARAGVHTLGVIDRDFRDDAEVKELEAENVVVLALHEAESYLCLPAVFAALAGAVGTANPSPTVKVVQDRIVAFARAGALQAALRRIVDRERVTVDLSLTGSEMAAVTSSADAAALLATKVGAKWSVVEWQKADAIRSLIDAEVRKIDAASQKEDVDALLRLIPGKQLLAGLAKSIGLRSSMEVLHAARKHLRPESFPALADLRDRLRKGLGLEKTAVGDAPPLGHAHG